MKTKTTNTLMIACLLLFTLLSAFQSMLAQSTYDAFIDEKYDDKKLSIDLLCDEIDALESDNPSEILARVVTKIDGHDRTICGLYNDGLQIVSSRSPLFGVTPFVPANYPDLVNAVRNGKSGSMNVWYDSEGLPPHTIKVYYRWVGNLVIIVGVSKYTTGYVMSSAFQNAYAILSAASYVFFAGTVIVLIIGRKRSGNGRYS